MRRLRTKHQGTVLEDETPRSEGSGSTSRGRLKENVQSGKRKIRSCKKHTIGTWNVRNMDEGKLETIKQVMKDINIVLLGVSELNWIGKGYFQSDEYVVIYSGNDEFSRNGVAFIVRQDIAQAIRRYNPKSDRVISVRVQGQPVSITVIQVDAPGPNDAAEEMESFYASIQEEVDLTPERDVLLIIGDWNATVGDQPEPNIVGNFGLGVRNEAGKRLIEFCGANNLFIANTCFMQPKRRLYTWASPKGQFRHQIDYIIGRRRWRASIESAKTRPRVDCGTDHKLLIATIKVKLRMNYTPSVVEQDSTSEASEGHIKNRSALSNSVSHNQKELGAQAGEIKDTGNIAASFLMHEKIWFDKFRYDAAEKRYYAQMSDCLCILFGQQSASSPPSAGPAGDQSQLVIRLEAENQDLGRASPEVCRLEGPLSVLQKGST